MYILYIIKSMLDELKYIFLAEDIKVYIFSNFFVVIELM